MTYKRQLKTSVCVCGVRRGTTFILLLWFVFQKSSTDVCAKDGGNRAEEGGSSRGQRSSDPPLLTLPSDPVAAGKTGRRLPSNLLCRVSSQAEGVVAERILTGRNVSVAAVTVGVGEPVQAHQPRVQDLGVSTGHCQTGGDTKGG